ncbi:hypothetical protein BDV06DRAFT_36661 [Aspergillus oleicola]
MGHPTVYVPYIGNCTWDPVASLAVRALCSNVTSSMKRCDHLFDESSYAPYDNCTVSLPNGTLAFYTNGYELQAIALQIEPSLQPIVYTNATLPVIQRIEAVTASTTEGWYVASTVCDDARFGCAMRNVADAMSKSFRGQAYITNGQEMNMVVGHMHVNPSIVHVRWQWLTLPLLVWLLGAVTWIGTEWKTRHGKAEKWGDDSLPLLYLYRGGDGSGTANQMQGVLGQAFERRAKSIRAQLYTQKDRAAFFE